MIQKLNFHIAKAVIATLALSLLGLPTFSLAAKDQQDPNFSFPGFVSPVQFPGFAHHARVCNHEAAGNDLMSCDAHVVTDAQGRVHTNSVPSGYGPKQFLGAYNLSGQASGKKIIGIVDAYDDPNIQKDLNTYSNTMGITSLPTCVGSTASSSAPCFQKVNQNGVAGNYPFKNSGWDLEIALDVEIAHAACQNCSIVLVEARNNQTTNLMSAIDTAARLGANVISDSWGGSEFSGETSYDYHFNHPGVAITFSSGDSGYGAEYPAASSLVTAVGGTTLHINSDNSYNNENAWDGSGSGCSAYESKPAWQTDSACARRTVADVSADADPVTGAAVYDSIPYQNQTGWFQVGGTSLASPLIAATYALSGNTSSPQLPYSNPSALHDIVSGSNGSCGGSYLCTAKPGYDGPTGLGSPNGVSDF